MTTNREQIEYLEGELGNLQDIMKRMELGVNDKLHHLEETLSKLADSIGVSRGTPSHSIHDQTGSSRPLREEAERGRHQFASQVVKLDCPRYSGEDPTEWYNRITQFFEYQEVTDEQKVSLASFHLEGEANQWWQWLRQAYREKEGQLCGKHLWKNYGPVLVLQIVKTMMRHY